MTAAVGAAERLHDIFSSSDTPPLVWAYLRASVSAQEAETSLSTQANEAIKYCRKHGLDDPQIVDEVADAQTAAVSTRLEGDRNNPVAAPRPTLLTLLGHLAAYTSAKRKTRCDLLVWRLDRLSTTMVEQEVLIDFLRSNKIRLHAITGSSMSMTTGEFVADPLRLSIRQALQAREKYARVIDGIVSDDKMVWRTLAGQFTGGRPPYGYRVVDGELQVDETEANIVRAIFKLRAGPPPMPMDDIAEYLDKNRKPGDVTHYTRHKITSIIRRESMYLGIYRDCYGKQTFQPRLKILDTLDLHHEQETHIT